MPGLHSWQGGTKSIMTCRLALKQGLPVAEGNSVQMYGGLSGFAEATSGCEAFTSAQVSVS